MRRRGFTFLELLIVVLLLGILTQLAVVTLGPAYDERRLAGAAREVAAALEYAKQTAQGTGGGARVTFTTANAEFRVEQIVPLVNLTGSDTSLAQGNVETTSATLLAYPPNPLLGYDVSMAADSRFGGIAMQSAVFGTGTVVTFDGFGTPSSNGSIVLALKGITYTVGVAAASGVITTTSP